MAGDRAAFHAVICGRVQGVGFRDYVEIRARVLRLQGYVRNLPDHRSVEVLAEGDRDALGQLIEHLKEGPAMSRVDTVDVDWCEPTGQYEDFGSAW